MASPLAYRLPCLVGLLAGLLVLPACLDPVTHDEPETTADADVLDDDSSAVFKPKIDVILPDWTMGGTDALAVDAAGDAADPEDSVDTTADDVALPDAASEDAALPPDDTTGPDDTAGPPEDATVVTGCGDGTCKDGESCATCPKDCGACPPVCGDGKCNGAELCGTCPGDCGPCPPPVCSVLGSATCKPGEQCYPDGKQNVCFVAGKAEVGAKCQGFNDCAVGALCVAGLCRAVCDAGGKKADWLCKPGIPCEKLVFEGAGEVGDDLGACKPSDDCNPLTDVGCEAGKVCVPFGWLKTCQAPGTGKLGDACKVAAHCGKGLLCVDVGGSSKCRARCDTGGGNPSCDTGSCSPVLGPDGQPTPGKVGYCG